MVLFILFMLGLCALAAIAYYCNSNVKDSEISEAASDESLTWREARFFRSRYGWSV